MSPNISGTKTKTQAPQQKKQPRPFSAVGSLVRPASVEELTAADTAKTQPLPASVPAGEPSLYVQLAAEFRRSAEIVDLLKRLAIQSPSHETEYVTALTRHEANESLVRELIMAMKA
jgi:hypothetical protein